MPTKSQLRRRIFASILITVLAIGTYSRIPGTESVRLVIVLTLITIGLGIGVFLANFFAYVRAKNNIEK